MLVSAALAGATFAAALATLALYLNPSLSLLGEARALLLCLFLPWAAAASVGLFLLAAAASGARWGSARRPLVPRRPYFATLAFLALAAVAGLYWFNLRAYRDALPLEVLRALWLSALAVSLAALALVAIGIDR